MKKKLITEFSRNVQVEKTSNDLYIKGVFSSAELLNNNGRRYRKDILTREIDNIMEKVNNKCLWGELSHPANPDINPDKIAILTDSLEWDNNDVVGRAKVLDTPMGNIAKTLIKEGKIGISSRGLGTVSENDNYVNEDFQLLTWDLVMEPSNNPSWVKGIYEGKEFDITSDIIDEDIIEAKLNQFKVGYIVEITEGKLKGCKGKVTYIGSGHKFNKLTVEMDESRLNLLGQPMISPNQVKVVEKDLNAVEIEQSINEMVGYYQSWLLKEKSRADIISLYEKNLIRWPV